MSVVTKPLAVALGLRWKPSTRTDVIAVDGKPQAAVGVVDGIPVLAFSSEVQSHVMEGYVKIEHMICHESTGVQDVMC